MTVTVASRPTGHPGYCETLPSLPESAGAARRLVGAACAAWGLAGPAEDGGLVVSELVANAVRHAPGPGVRVAVERLAPRRVRVAVSDFSQVRPVLRAPGGGAEGGRGLLLVAALASDWGADVRSWGKTVWAELQDPPEPEEHARVEEMEDVEDVEDMVQDEQDGAALSGSGAEVDEGRTWTITTSDGQVVRGFLPAWAANDPSAAGVVPGRLPAVLEEMHLYGELFEGEVLPSNRPSDLQPCVVFGVSLHCNPFSDTQTGVPVIAISVTEDEMISGLGVADVGRVARALERIADRLKHVAIPALVEARTQWAAAHHARTAHQGPPPLPDTRLMPAAVNGEA